MSRQVRARVITRTLTRGSQRLVPGTVYTDDAEEAATLETNGKVIVLTASDVDFVPADAVLYEAATDVARAVRLPEISARVNVPNIDPCCLLVIADADSNAATNNITVSDFLGITLAVIDSNSGAIAVRLNDDLDGWVVVSIPGVGGIVANTHRYNQNPLEAPNGSLVDFTLPGGDIPVAGSLRVYVRVDGADSPIRYHGITDNADGTFTFTTVPGGSGDDPSPLTDSEILCDYEVSS